MSLDVSIDDPKPMTPVRPPGGSESRTITVTPGTGTQYFTVVSPTPVVSGAFTGTFNRGGQAGPPPLNGPTSYTFTVTWPTGPQGDFPLTGALLGRVTAVTVDGGVLRQKAAVANWTDVTR